MYTSRRVEPKRKRKSGDYIHNRVLPSSLPIYLLGNDNKTPYRYVRRRTASAILEGGQFPRGAGTLRHALV